METKSSCTSTGGNAVLKINVICTTKIKIICCFKRERRNEGEGVKVIKEIMKGDEGFGFKRNYSPFNVSGSFPLVC
jgi:hypothetical protein